MVKRVLYMVYLCIFVFAIAMQMKYCFGLQERMLEDFAGLSYVIHANLSFMVLGVLLAIEGKFAVWAGRAARIIGRGVAAVFLCWEIFKTPLLNELSWFSNWNYVMSAAGIVAAYFLFSSVVDLVSCLVKKKQNPRGMTELEMNN